MRSSLAGMGSTSDGQLRRLGAICHPALLRNLLVTGLMCPSALFGCTSEDEPAWPGNGGSSGQAGAIGSTNGGSAMASAGATGGGADSAGGSAIGGASNQLSEIAGIAGASSGPDRCPASDSSTGTLLRPPSNGFEIDLNGWHTMAGIDAHLSRVQDPNGACEGTAYLVCSGPGGADGWDAPIIEITQYLASGHEYQVTLITRFAPGNAPTQPAEIALFSNTVCDTPSITAIPAHDLLVRESVHTD